MSFTTVTVTGTLLNAQQQALAGAQIAFTLSTAITDGNDLLSPLPQVATCDSSGAFSIALAANDDSTTTPTGSTYAVRITDAIGSLIATYTVTVGHAKAPSVDLFSIL